MTKPTFPTLHNALSNLLKAIDRPDSDMVELTIRTHINYGRATVSYFIDSTSSNNVSGTDLVEVINEYHRRRDWELALPSPLQLTFKEPGQ